MDNYNNELEFKNHNPFFLNLNNNFQELLNKYQIMKTDIRQLENIYICLDSFYLFYYPYLKEHKSLIEEKLKAIHEIVYSFEFQQFLKTKNINPDFYNKLVNCFNVTGDIIKIMMSDLHNNELFPTLRKTDNTTPIIARGRGK